MTAFSCAESEYHDAREVFSIGDGGRFVTSVALSELHLLQDVRDTGTDTCSAVQTIMY